MDHQWLIAGSSIDHQWIINESSMDPPRPQDNGQAWLGFGRLAWFALAWPRLSQLTSPQLGLSQEQQQQPAEGQLLEGLRPSNVVALVTSRAEVS